MFKIQTTDDVNRLNLEDGLPASYVKEIDFYFKAWVEEINERRLPSHACIYHFDKEDDGQMLMNHLHEIEYVDVETASDGKHFRIGLMQDHQMSLIFVLSGVLLPGIERRLEKLGDVNV